MRLNKHINILVLSFILTISGFAQLHVKNYFSITGKKDVPVYVIYQDFDGFLWLATGDGLYKFDGKTSQSINLNNHFNKKDISALFMDSKENLWIGTKRGAVYRLSKKYIIDSLQFKNSENTSKITSFYEQDNCLCIGTYGNGIFTFNNQTLYHYTDKNGLSDNVVYKIEGDKMGTVWCGTDAGITTIKHLPKNPSIKIISNKDGLPDNIVRDLVFVENQLIVTMQDSGVCYFNPKKNTFIKPPFFRNWSLGTVINAGKQSATKLVIATEKSGMIVLDNGNISRYNYSTLLQVSSVHQVFIDRAKQIWVAHQKGISQFNEKRFNLIDAASGLKDDKVLAIATDNDHAIWIGTTMGISRIQTDEDGKRVFTKVQDLKKYTISCAVKASDGNIWFGTYGNGIIILSSETKNSVIINSSDDQLPNDNISNIYFADKNTVYISTLGGGLVKARVELDEHIKVFKVEKTYTEVDGLGNSYVYTSITDTSGKLFVATDGGGLQVFENNKFVDLTAKFKLKSNTIFNLCKDAFNTIWATSNEDGILKYDGNTLISLSQAQGLRDLQPQQLIAVDKTIYAFNSRGIDKIDCKTNAISYTDLFDIDLEPNLNAVCFDEFNIMSGTGKGLLVYRTNKEACDSVKPCLYLKALQINYKPFPFDSINEFSYRQNNISIAFDGLWLKNPDKLVYRYRLTGLEEEWMYVNEGKTISYNNLNPGNYTFIVQVKNEEDVWSEPQGYSFIINTPLWKRWWFWLLIVVVGVSSIYLFLKYRLKALQKENLILENRVAERTFEIEKQSKIIAEKNKDITDSISYARKIQHAILPPEPLIRKYIPKSFLLYLTKDIVSGDFYWFTHFDNCSIIACVDCTGHGVPGAFMSLIGYNILNRVVNENEITDPKDILLHLNKGVLGVLHKNQSDSKDGMDIAICKINHGQGTLEYAGAMRPLWIVNNGELEEIKADKIPIGTKQKDREETIAYTTHTFELNKGSSFYIFTDGYGDQFGGPKDKKFSTGKFKDLILENAKLEFSEQELLLKKAHLDWKAENEQVDDILVIGFTL